MIRKSGYRFSDEIMRQGRGIIALDCGTLEAAGASMLFPFAARRRNIRLN
jgi:hypothetical protein